MDLSEGRKSKNVEDRRRARRVPVPGGQRGAVGIGGLGLVLILLFAVFTGADPIALLESVSQPMDAPAGGPSTGFGVGSAEEDELAEFVALVLGDTEDTWSTLFAEAGRQYEEPTLVLYTDQVRSACGFGQAAMGPFYCPGDANLYIDLSFFDDLHDRYGAPGDFAQAYVVAHEVGHHVQNELGILGEVTRARQRVGGSQSNELAVRLELQADCLAGIWAHHAERTRDVLEAGDIDEGLNAAAAVGDDRMQMRSRGYVVPDSFTHGSSRQRATWFRRGLVEGTLAACDTFSR